MWHISFVLLARRAKGLDESVATGKAGFRAGKAPLLGITGVTVQAIEVSNATHVINYDQLSMDHSGIQEHVH
ncbi:hypothetical protein MGN70_008563 [Eutypa lata]|nr:hypothetical protein MGN70_008563 [Eutypa lata]